MRPPQTLGIEVLALAPGRASMRMTVRPDMVQGHGTCHGGIVFALADSAFAAACNGGSRRPVFVASAEITWIAPAFLGDAAPGRRRRAHTVRSQRRHGRHRHPGRADGALLALFRGRSVEARGRPLAS